MKETSSLVKKYYHYSEDISHFLNFLHNDKISDKRNCEFEKWRLMFGVVVIHLL